MLKTFKTRGIGAGSFFKILFLGNFVWILLASIVIGIVAWVMPQSPAATAEQQYSAIAGHPMGLGIMILLSPLVALIASFSQWLTIGFGFWLWTRFRCVCLTISVADECGDKANDGQCH